MDLKRVTIESKAVFDEFYKKNPPKTSYHSFANLFLWRECENLEYAEVDGLILITGISVYDRERYVMFPLGEGNCKKLTKELIQIFGLDFKILAITEDDANNVDKLCTNIFNVEHVRSMDNYIYDIESLISLSGKKLHKKRNHVNKFKSLYDYVYEPVTDENATECLYFVAKWYREKEDVDRSILEFEKKATRDSILYHKELGIKAGIIKVDNKVIAFSAGEQVSDDTVVINIEKADINYQGVYATINNEFLKNEWSHLKYVNREEDMGIEGLRKSKLSYYPCEIRKMYSAIPKEV